VAETSESARERVKDTLTGLGATITRVGEDGVDFELGHITGFARERRGKFRASYFIAIGPDLDEATRFVADHDDVPDCEVQLLDDANGPAIRLLVELPYEEDQQIWTTAHTARALHAGWVNRHEDGTDLIATLGEAGIAVPPRGSDTKVHTYGAWSWGSRYVPPFLMYMFEVELVARQLIEHGKFFAMSHAGHGVNSYGLNLVTAQGPVAAFVQHGYGGAYTDPVRALIDINATFSRLHVLMRAVQDELPSGPRWLLTYSSFRQMPALIDLDQMRHGARLDDATVFFDSESELFEAAVERLQLRSIDFCTGGSVSW
jgi:hypothetical protein